jgi:chromosome segregation protein
MRLTRLEIKGFKSFADQTVINFNENITGIVGPNGSGKSNIVDAIRWVLGEQKTRELRTEKMDNVIFNGTDKRSKSGRAWVSMNFVNDGSTLPSEYNEVEISRTLYRTGESEYRLNNVKCRLKDITNLFMDTGIGSNSYAIITLGMVDDILLDRENFRRNMIEQAAGIEKYRQRKRKTYSKLSKTEDDLERLLDLLEEIGKNMRSLKIQAGRAKKYNDVKEDYRWSSLFHYRNQWFDFESKKTKKKSDLNTKKIDQTKLQVQKSKIEDRLEKLKLRVLNQEKKLNERQKNVNEHLNRIREKEGHRNILFERQKQLEKQVQLSETALKNSDQRKAFFEKRFEEIAQKIRSFDKMSKVVSQDLKELEQGLNHSSKKHEEIKTEIEALEQGRSLSREELNKIHLELALNQNKMRSLRNRNEIIQKSIHEAKKALNKISSVVPVDTQLMELNAKLEKIEFKKNKEREEIEQYREQLNQNFREQSTLQRKISGLESELNITRNMVESLEGYPDSVKLVSKNKKLKDKLDLFSDVINVSEEYKKAMEIFLSPFMNSMVSSDLASASKSIDLLRDAQGGKIDILLDQELPTLPSFERLEIEEAIPALDILEFDIKYSGLIKSIFHGVYIVPSIPAGYKIPSGITLVQSSGERVVSNHRMRGGSIGLFEGKKIGRKKNLDLLNRRINHLKSELDKLISEQKTLENKKSNLSPDRYKQKLNELYLKRQNLLSEKKVNEQRVSDYENKLASQSQEYSENVKLFSELETSVQHMEKRIEGFKEESSSFENKINSLNESWSEKKKEYDQINKSYNNKKIEQINLNNKIEQLQKEAELLNSEHSRFLQELEISSNQLNTGQQKIDKLNQEISALDSSLEHMYKIKDKDLQSLNSEEQNYYKDREIIKGVEEEQRNIVKHESSQSETIHRLQVELNELDYKMRELLNRLDIEFGSRAVEEFHEIDSSQIDPSQDYQSQCKKLQERLKLYGNVNPLAIESFEEVKNRYEDLEKQHQDIIQAKESLMDTIDEIDHEAKKRFEQTLASLKVNFQTVFRELFSQDDTCEILLTNDDDVLNSTIKIIAKPKGKRPQSINQLSGGEKTLTATAFLFALYLLKPAPFCIFDEVDAPLDDQNILKFNKIIKRFSENSQFIIITHNKLTMNAMDVIYGISMGEKGVSQVSGVDFRALKNPVIHTP